MVRPTVKASRDNSSSLDPLYGVYNYNPPYFLSAYSLLSSFHHLKLDSNLLKGGTRYFLVPVIT